MREEGGKGNLLLCFCWVNTAPHPPSQLPSYLGAALSLPDDTVQALGDASVQAPGQVPGLAYPMVVFSSKVKSKGGDRRLNKYAFKRALGGITGASVLAGLLWRVLELSVVYGRCSPLPVPHFFKERGALPQALEAATRDQENKQKVRKLPAGLEGGMCGCTCDHSKIRDR